MTAVLIIIGVVALIAAGLGIFFFLKKTKEVRKGTEEKSETKTKKMGENTKPSKPEFKEKVEKPTLSLMYELKEMLKSIFKCEVDLVRFRSSLRPLFRSNILNDVVYV